MAVGVDWLCLSAVGERFIPSEDAEGCELEAKWCWSSQLPPRQPALRPPLPWYSGRANPQLSHMPCLLDV
ncbi:hypothetical protein EYF80_019623 [Liparis tanakae]|uniref:Uncharacterized protein n=1 Tax=Liparis tanakae TaxID=230148 RepID=A0A4Z2HYR6_9TELE|nr:hypothetical protein EYF80_019623 [Liparis tanakae]